MARWHAAVNERLAALARELSTVICADNAVCKMMVHMY